MRNIRHCLARRPNPDAIENKHLKNLPIFQSIFGASWDKLPPVMHKHYANRPYSDDIVVVEGTLDIMCAGPIKWLAPLIKLMGQIPPINESGVPVTVEFKSDTTTKAFHFRRTFNFKHASPHIFHTRMVQLEENEVLEIMSFGLCWRTRYGWENGKVILQHRGYHLRLFGFLMPLPLTILIGEGYAEEIAVDDKAFQMVVHITHPWWGKVYEYTGQFEVKNSDG